MLPQPPGQTQQVQRLGKGNAVRLNAGGQGGPPGFGLVVGGFSPLHVGTVLAGEKVDGLAGLRVHTQGFRAGQPVLVELPDPLRVQIRRGHVRGQIGLDVLPVMVGLQIGAELADAHHAGELLQRHGPEGGGVDGLLLMGHFRFQALLAAVELLQIREPLHLALGDLVKGSLHAGREAGIHQVREVLLQQGRHREGGERGDQGIGRQLGVAPVTDGADDGGVGAGAANALRLQPLHQGRFREAGGGLGLVVNGLYGPATGPIT